MISPASIDKWARTLASHPVGTGPYSFKEYVKNSHATLVRNPDYNWGAAFFQNKGPVVWEQFISYVIPDVTALSTALETGELQIIERVSGLITERLQKAGFGAFVTTRLVSAQLPLELPTFPHRRHQGAQGHHSGCEHDGDRRFNRVSQSCQTAEGYP